ncbi:hypothetical protein PtA15_8A738 [Puccinia triticina]|uniref:YMC020W-like alpha/beta hydrolase domain-containing protein n=1 Tax=Puccinia triticina TaxID=208348 RepID=A0ABY7CRD2_9BASI|nr:uncharacterized protein PtA15_8A738 [Puccinia triticina]WAQ87831.1 hypothetical protein PtA15_8A738 [Puccinia triticina]
MPQDDNRTTRTTESSSADSWSTWLSIQPPATEPTPHYLTQLGAWAYSWLPAQPQLGTVERTAIIPQNPISDSIPANSKGWTAYFSSRRALPIHKLKEHPPSIEAMKTSLKNKGQHKLPNLQTFELVQALIFSAPPEFPQTVATDALPSRRESSRQRRQAADILHHNQHISTRLPKALDLLGVDRPARIRKLNRLAVIAIHGWFPGPWLESVLGKPTGTSAKFASMMDHALRIYLRQQTGEGKVDDRVRLLFNQLISRQHWLEAVQNADAIFVDPHVFELAVRYFFESSSPLDPPTNVPAQPGGKTRRTGSSAEEDGGGRDELPGGLMVVDQSLSPKDKPNPFLLTWSLRGLIEDPRIRLMFAAELRFLKASFLHWTPADLKVKLEPFKEVQLD